jgi:hypothetical protein
MFKDDDIQDAELNFFLQWRDQLASEQIPPLSLGTDAMLQLESDVLGCHIIVTCENESPAIELAESLLAATESLLSTGLGTSLIAREPMLSVSVKASEFAEDPFSFRLVHEKGRPQVFIAYRSFKPHSLSHEAQGAIKECLVKLLIEIFSNIIVVPDDAVLKSMFANDRALQRAVDFTGSFVTVGNVLGYEPKARIEQWFDTSSKVYKLLRDSVWDSEHKAPLAKTSEAQPVPSPPGEDRTREQLLARRTKAKHSEVRTISLIREKLWNAAKWSGVVFLTYEADVHPPVMGLLFGDPDSAMSIFEGLREDLGEEDSDEKLRVGIVRGVSAAHPAWYRVVIGTDPSVLKQSKSRDLAFAMFVSRIHEMTPESTANIERFLASYTAYGRYVLAPAVMKDGKPIIANLTLLKRSLHVKDAWQVNENDPEVVAIREEDDIIIPPGKTRVPLPAVRRRRND